MSIGFIPRRRSWEIGIENDSGAYDIYSNVEPGFYSMAQRVSLPNLVVCHHLFRTTVSGRSLSEPGREINSVPSAFRSMPKTTIHFPEQFRFFPVGTACCRTTPPAMDGFIIGLTFPILTGIALWFSHDWDPQTPSAPEVKAVRSPDATLYNRLGIGAGDTRRWSNLGYALVFRYRFLTVITPDSSNDCGWRKAGSGNGPEGFLVTRYGGPGAKAITEWCNPADTLFRLLPDGPGDSVGIRTGCDGLGGEEKLMLTFDSNRVLPINVEAECEAVDSSSGACTLRLTSRSPDTLRLSAGYDRGNVQILSDRITLSPWGSIAIPAIIKGLPNESRNFAVIFEETSRSRYPYLIIVECTFSGPTIVGDPGDNQAHDGSFSVFPNPLTPGKTARFKTARSNARFMVFNILGQQVAEFSVGSNGETVWDERDEKGRLLPSGVYFARLEGGRGQPATVKLVLVR